MTYRTILTQAGLSAIAAAHAMGVPLDLAAMASRGLPVFLWSAGGGSTGSQTYPFSIEPLLATPDTDRPQWEFIEPFVRAFNF